MNTVSEFVRQISEDPLWFSVGMTAQFMFFLRFFIQWVVSERKKQSVVPVVFWYLSMVGGVLLLVYSVHKRDAVFTLGSVMGCYVYMRNLRLVSRLKAQEAELPH